jgi:hypothetical protein
MKALSIRQPWAWLIVNGFKNIENRTWPTHYRGEILVHAGQAMTRSDYDACAIFCAGLSFKIPNFPRFQALKGEMGGIVGKCEVIDCVTSSDSEWFVGEFGFLVRNAVTLPFERCKGALGFFPVHERLKETA